MKILFLKHYKTAIIVFLLVLLAIKTVSAMGPTVTFYENLYEQKAENVQDKEKELDYAQYELCVVTVKLANTKLVDHHSGEAVLQTEDYARVANKSRLKCVDQPKKKVQVAETVQPEVQPMQTCVKTTAGEDQNQYVRYASEISNNDLDFLATLNAENGLWDPKRRSSFEDSWGFCQFHRAWHSKTVDDPRFFSDPKWQLDQCWRAYKGGTRFYGFDVRGPHKKQFSCPTGT